MKLFVLNLLLFISIFSFSQTKKNSIYIYVTTESTNTFSVKHALKVAGVPFQTIKSFDSLFLSKIILFTETIDENSLSNEQVEKLTSYVSNGGIIIATQLKQTSLFSLFGVESYKFKTNRQKLTWNTSIVPEEAYLINDTLEKNQLLADSSNATIFGTRAYSLKTGKSFLTFENEENAGVINQLGKGFTYLFGFNWEDVILRNQVLKHFKANRTYSNGFEPGSDVLYHFIRGIYRRHIPFAVHKHTCINNSKSMLIITHDVDATSAIKDIMTDFSSYEYENNIRSTYFVTTHYMHDSVAKNFWDGYTSEIKSVLAKKHEIASHSVSHTPDFDNSSIVPIGECETLNHSNYKPFFDGKISNNVSVCGETKVSKSLLDTYAGANVKSFRAGYLAYNKGILDALEQTNYTFNSSHSANNVLTGYPFQGHLNLSMNSPASTIYEIPNTISDVFMDERISEENYPKKVAIWTNVQKRYQENETPVVLLIHPNRPWKITAQQNFIKNLDSTIAIIPFEEYGHFWKEREEFQFETEFSEDSIITISFLSDTINPKQSLIIHNGLAAKKIVLLSKNKDTLQFLSDRWNENDLILFHSRIKEKYTEFEYIENQSVRNIDIFPNPAEDYFQLNFELVNDSDVLFEMFDQYGKRILTPYNQRLELGVYKTPIVISQLNAGIYFYTLYINNEKIRVGKIVKR